MLVSWHVLSLQVAAQLQVQAHAMA